MSAIEITVFRKKTGVLSKRIKLDADGVPHSGAACKMQEGEGRRVKLDSVDALAELIRTMPSEEALTLGRLRANLPDNVEVILKNKLNGSTPTNVIARSSDFLHFAAGAPAFMLLDYDGKGQPHEVAQQLKRHGGFWKAVVSVVPELANAARVSRLSTSAGLYNRRTKEQLKKAVGRRVYLAVKDGSDIERALKTLHDRLWLAGLGYFVVGAVGQLLDRSIIDAAVYGPERLVFEGAPILVPPVAQDEKKRRPFVHHGETIDSSVAIPPLTDDEQARVAQLKAAAKERLKPEAAVQRKAWANKRAERGDISVEEAERIAADATERHILQEDFELVFDELGEVTVGDVLAAPDDYVGMSLADPLEGVSYGRGKAKVYRLPDRRLMIHSFAHGDINYKLAGQGVGLDDFYAYLQQHNYFYAPTREPWPAASVNNSIPPVPLLDAKGQPILNAKGKPLVIPANEWLDKHRRVVQITWAPGFPMVIEDSLIDVGGGWVHRNAVSCFNLYRPPDIISGDPDKAEPWLEHVEKIFPDDAEHIIKWLAHRVQRPWEKINHALFLGGDQGIGKDTLLEPLKQAIGPSNFREVSPQQVMGRFNGFLKAVILRVNEARDLGDYNRYAFYDHMKAYTAAPPDVLRVDEKNLREYSILNVCGVTYTSNHKTDGIYLTADDRRHYVAWSEMNKENFATDYWNKLWGWYENGGSGHVAAYLADIDLSDFDAKASPPKTAAFWSIVEAGSAPEDFEIADAIDALGKPQALTLDDLIRVTESDEFSEWLGDRRNSRQIPHRLEACGYVAVRNNDEKEGRWRIAGKRMVVYAQKSLPLREQHQAAKERVNSGVRRVQLRRRTYGGE